MASLSKASVPAKDLRPLKRVKASELVLLTPPSTLIRTDEDVEHWKNTQGYEDYSLFIRRLNESVVGHFLPDTSEVVQHNDSSAVHATLALLDELDRWIDDIPPHPTPQRFGNLAFRLWGQRLEERAETLLSELLPPSLAAAVPLLTPYLLTSFGSFTRLDYGTGHETSFAIFLLGLSLIRFYDIDVNTEEVASEQPPPRLPESQPPQPEERDLVLRVFLRYLKLCWRLQDVYRLEPAGSHGVWGLDDYHFLGYIFGSAQLRNQGDVPVSAVLRPPLAETNLYFMQINRIHALKTGPFHEHSSQLFAIATGVPHWPKANQGLLKMYDAEVLGKRVVVQHLPLGGLLVWNSSTNTNNVENSHPAPTLTAPNLSGGTSAPLATTSQPSAERVQLGVQSNLGAPWSRTAQLPSYQPAVRASGPVPPTPDDTAFGVAPRAGSLLPPILPRAGQRRPQQ